ncbi:MAG: hypothetical protein RM347_009125 [Nostoc sp. ChiQUE02]|uniref:hypothetical protein n=1 Tax=Nostoc sp. ChiQUE02 TaxID=3075377 RepID=UPI002AD37EA5|nr:hypothetical protein [Nostoc sp. ChiQUE02]MDZ8232889.1 hypothetical protein [Nostoc sp. ChiQUE02]
MNDKLKAASEILEMLGYAAPHSEEDCEKIINFREEYFCKNEISSIESAKVRAEHGTLGLFAGLQKIANELKAKAK